MQGPNGEHLWQEAPMREGDNWYFDALILDVCGLELNWSFGLRNCTVDVE